ncbi:MAG: hypothetical protein ABIQ38_00170 [Ilumatobacteraceae bacterium]
MSFTKHKAGLMADLSANRTIREPLTIGRALHAVGGVLIGLAIVFFTLDVFSNDSGPNVAGGFIFSLVGILALWFVAFRGRSLIIWATAGLQIMVPFAFLWLRSNSFFSFEFALSFILASLAMAVLWSLPGFRARPSILAAALLWGVLGIILLIVQSDLADLINGMGLGSLGKVASDAGFITMLIGIGLLLVGRRFDRKMWPNLGTPFIGVGVFSLIFGTFGYLSRDDLGDVLSAILVVVLSLAVVSLGVSAKRRATTWIATFFLSIGFITLITTVLSDDASWKAIAISFAIVAAVLGFCGKRVGQAVEAETRG